MQLIEVSKIVPNKWNANTFVNEEYVKLKEMMAKTGIEQMPPIIVRKIGDVYEIIDGEHRWRAAKELGLKQVAVKIIEADDEKAKELCMSYNKLRGHLNWFKVLDILTADMNRGVDIYKLYGKVFSAAEIANILSLAKITPKARLLLEEAVKKHPSLTLSHICPFTKIDDAEMQEIAIKQMTRDTLLTERSINALVKTCLEELSRIKQEKELEERAKQANQPPEQWNTTQTITTQAQTPKTITPPYTTYEQTHKIEHTNITQPNTAHPNTAQPNTTQPTAQLNNRPSTAQHAVSQPNTTAATAQPTPQPEAKTTKCFVSEYKAQCPHCNITLKVEASTGKIAYKKSDTANSEVYEYLQTEPLKLVTTCPRQGCGTKLEIIVNGKPEQSISCWRCGWKAKVNVYDRTAVWNGA
ncbi:MAG: ParB N-terminal domain-containing protein [Candidatus Bathyarchaeota archaeon]|nr:ParB N-terminal domain-containing protein [Candidatus Bathyarchaeota archaeon]